MKKLVLKSLPYLLIILLYGLVGEYFLFRNKESIPIKSVSKIQSKGLNELYYGRKILGNSLSNYKFQRLMDVQPEILVLGQSITLQFRDFMFSPFENDFYNTGLMARNAKDLDYVLDLIENGEIKKPRLVFLGIDLSFFLRNTMLDNREWTRNYPDDRATSAKSHLKGMQRIFKNRSLWKFPTKDVGFGRYGMQGRGYRNDGSYRHEGEISRFLEDNTYHDGILIDKLKQRLEPFIEPFDFSTDKEINYYNVLDRFKRNGIELLLYIPPYSDTFFKEAIKDTMFAQTWKKFIEIQQELIDKSYNVIPFTTPSQMGLSDNYMVDAEHPGEVFCALQLRQAVRKGSMTGEYINRLDFRIIDSLLNKKNKIPFSFMRDEVNGTEWTH